MFDWLNKKVKIKERERCKKIVLSALEVCFEGEVLNTIMKDRQDRLAISWRREAYKEILKIILRAIDDKKRDYV